MKSVICFGEIMARLSPPGQLRLRQVMPGNLEVTFAGAEANAGAAIAALGGAVEFVTALPDNEISEACLANLRSAALGVRHVVRREEGRFGLYFVETGANQRAGLVVYDRGDSTFACTGAEHYSWPEIMAGADWFHTTGVALSLSRLAATATLAATQAAKAAGLSVSFDINHRRKLWRWDDTLEPEALARRTLGQIMPSVDVVIGNAMDMAMVAGMDSIANGIPMVEQAPTVARAAAKRFPHLRQIVISLRENISASHNNFGAMTYLPAEDRCCFAPETGGNYAPYEIRDMVDRIGAGDAFAGALIHALKTPEHADPAKALQFAVAAACLAHSIQGDFNYCTRAEVEALIRSGGAGWVAR